MMASADECVHAGARIFDAEPAVRASTTPRVRREWKKYESPKKRPREEQERWNAVLESIQRENEQRARFARAVARCKELQDRVAKSQSCDKQRPVWSANAGECWLALWQQPSERENLLIVDALR